MLEQILSGFIAAFTYPNILFVLLGATIGLVFGTMPGLGPIVTLAILIPLSVPLGPSQAMALFGGALGGVTFGGSISAILINVPGTGPNAATLLDGYPMTRNGESRKALGASATASALGAIFGLLVLILLIPFAREIILMFGAPEFFMLTLLGICVIAFVTRGNFLHGLIAGGLGLLMSFIGFSPLTGTLRYDYIELFAIPLGQRYFYEGIKIVPAAVGIFAISEAIYLGKTKRETIADRYVESSASVFSGIKSVFQHYRLFIQSSVIGTVVGMIPGVGGVVANFLSYVRATQTKTNPERFGTGDVRGVIASEAANDSKDGGALVPTLAFGIPGNASTAILLGALVMHGITPGPALLETELDIAFTLIGALIFANIFVSIAGVLLADHLTKVTTISTTYIIPLILVICCCGVYIVNRLFGDVVIAVLFGIVGYFMIVHGYSRIAFIIGLILGGTAEIVFHQSMDAYGQGLWVFVSRPISLLFFLIILFTLSFPAIQRKLNQ